MYTDGRDISIRYTGYTEDPPQITIIDSSTDRLVPNTPNITLTTSTTVPYSKNLMYEPIPYDFLLTAETKP